MRNVRDLSRLRIIHISTSSRPPHEYDEVMGITQVEQREAERFEEGVEPEFQDAEEDAIREEDNGTGTRTHESGVSHRGIGSASLGECLDRMNQHGIDAPAPCHSGVKIDENAKAAALSVVFELFCSNVSCLARMFYLGRSIPT